MGRNLWGLALVTLTSCSANGPDTFSNSVSGPFVATGGFTTSECTSYFLFQTCPRRTIIGYEDSAGIMRAMPRAFDRVSETNGRVCFINTSSRGLGAISSALNAVKAPSFFWEDEHGEIRRFKPEYIVFKCEKQPGEST